MQAQAGKAPAKKGFMWRVHDSTCPGWLLRKVPVLKLIHKVMPCCRISSGKEKKAAP
ncbi:MAG: hypothetical protein HYX97_03950 [Chloroflexi bacterium]|nr:hypothetical protein [Chloroflexota bacterium]